MSKFNPSMPSVSQARFASVPRADIPRSRFDRSHGYKTTFDAGYLVPIFVDEALPGDTFSLSMTAFARMATPLHPIMDNLYMDTFFFAVPYRLVWENWEKFNGAQEAPEDSTDYIVPQVQQIGGVYQPNSVFDYFGLPIGVPGFQHSALPLRAYNLIWNEWFRDQNLQDPVPFSKGDGPDPSSTFELLRRGKRHDYFTSALPWPQKGPSVSIPLGQSAPVVGTAELANRNVQGNPQGGGIAIESVPGSGYRSPFLREISGAGDTSFAIRVQNGVVNHDLEADLTAATATTINQLRQAFQIQKLYERDARGGTRYTEIILSHFGVQSPDARLQRPEFLGGGSTPVNISPVASTVPNDNAPQGNLAGVGTALAKGHGFHKSFTEHCIIIGLANVRADLTYQQGMDRMWSRRTRFDFYWPALSHLGEQAILRKEIYTTPSESENNEVFGYQERFAEYRYKPSRITGLFRSTAPQSLDVWHLSQEFESAPVLSEDFIVDDPPIDRVVAVPSEPHFLFDSYFRLHCARPMPVYSVPGLIDHF